MFFSHLWLLIFIISEFHSWISFFSLLEQLCSQGSTWINNITHPMNTSVFLVAKQDVEIFPAYLAHPLKKYVSNESKKQAPWSVTGPPPRKWPHLEASKWALFPLIRLLREKEAFLGENEIAPPWWPCFSRQAVEEQDRLKITNYCCLSLEMLLQLASGGFSSAPLPFHEHGTRGHSSPAEFSFLLELSTHPRLLSPQKERKKEREDWLNTTAGGV